MKIENRFSRAPDSVLHLSLTPKSVLSEVIVSACFGAIIGMGKREFDTQALRNQQLDHKDIEVLGVGAALGGLVGCISVASQFFRHLPLARTMEKIALEIQIMGFMVVLGGFLLGGSAREIAGSWYASGQERIGQDYVLYCTPEALAKIHSWERWGLATGAGAGCLIASISAIFRCFFSPYPANHSQLPQQGKQKSQ